jgi:hypothetical protein
VQTASGVELAFVEPTGAGTLPWMGRQSIVAHAETVAGEGLVRSSELRVHVVQESYTPFDAGPLGPQDVD